MDTNLTQVPTDDERWQGYDANGKPTTPVTRQQAADGVLHGAAQVWVWRMGTDGPEVLLQVRGDHLKTWPGHLDSSTGGHIDFGETPLQAALREAREELGLNLTTDRLTFLFVHHSRLYPRPDITDNDLQWVYAHRLVEGVEPIPNPDEVTDIRWMAAAEFRKLAKERKTDQPVVPNSLAYFATLLDELERMWEAA